MKELMNRMFVNPLRLAFKMFLLVWIVLFLNVFLKITFNYWQPYVIPTPQLVELGNFIDNHIWLQYSLNFVLYFINVFLMLLCSTQQWKLKNKKEYLIFIISTIICYVLNITFNFTTFISIYITIILPLIINKKKWLYVILTFILSNVFLLLSLWFEGFASVDNMNYVVRFLFQSDYYIMLILNYIFFNMIRIKREEK